MENFHREHRNYYFHHTILTRIRTTCGKSDIHCAHRVLFGSRGMDEFMITVISIIIMLVAVLLFANNEPTLGIILFLMSLGLWGDCND